MAESVLVIMIQTVLISSVGVIALVAILYFARKLLKKSLPATPSETSKDELVDF